MAFHHGVKSLLLIFLLLTGCNNSGVTLTKNQPETPATTPPPDSDPGTTPKSPLEEPALNLIDQVCGPLKFDDVSWPDEISENEKAALAIALNITGSFEGNSGWKNLAGNFDGQGISLGLMQQNLGQGTLQPLWIEMLTSHLDVMKNQFSSSQIQSMDQMLREWQTIRVKKSSSSELFPRNSDSNPLEENFSENICQQGATKNEESVKWAQKAALDSKGQVLGFWSRPLQNMAESSSYRSLQIQTSLSYFEKAQQYFQAFEFTQLRHLLLMYDFVIQNGSIGENHLKIYETWLDQNPSASEEARAFALLEARLTTVKDQYKEDVKARKSTIIRGTGTVHKKDRNLPQEFCYDSKLIVDTTQKSVIF